MDARLLLAENLYVRRSGVWNAHVPSVSRRSRKGPASATDELPGSGTGNRTEDAQPEAAKSAERQTRTRFDSTGSSRMS